MNILGFDIWLKCTQHDCMYLSLAYGKSSFAIIHPFDSFLVNFYEQLNEF